MHTIIKIAVVSVLSLFAIVGLVSISKAEITTGDLYKKCKPFVDSGFNPEKLMKSDERDTFACLSFFNAGFQLTDIGCAADDIVTLKLI